MSKIGEGVQMGSMGSSQSWIGISNSRVGMPSLEFYCQFRRKFMVLEGETLIELSAVRQRQWGRVPL